MKNTGVEAQNLFVAHMKASGNHVFRLRDSKDVNGLNKTKGIGRIAMFPCPADFLVAGKGTLQLVEVKSTYNETSFSYSDIRPAQRSAACICASLGSPYIFAIYSMVEKLWYILDCITFAEDIKAGKKSRKFKDMPACLQM